MKRLAFAHLGVVFWKLLVEYADVFVGSKRHPSGVQEPSRKHLIPYEIVSPQFRLTEHYLRGEHTLGEEHYRSGILDDSFVLFPKLVQRNPSVPGCSPVAPVESLIGEVTQDHVYASVRDLLHEFNAVTVQ